MRSRTRQPQTGERLALHQHRMPERSYPAARKFAFPARGHGDRDPPVVDHQKKESPSFDGLKNIEVDGSHCALGHHPAVVYAIADRLAQPKGAWKKFERRGWRALVFPDWRRA